MAAPFAIPVIAESLVATLKADGTLAALLSTVPSGFGTGPAVYGETAKPPGATYPFLSVGAPTEVPFNTMGGEFGSGGSQCTFQVKAFSIKTADDQCFAIMSRVKALLDAVDLALIGSPAEYETVWCEFEAVADLFQEDVGGKIVRQLPMIFRVYAHESA